MTITLRDLYDYQGAKTFVYRIIIAGADVTRRVANFEWGFARGEVPNATIVIPKSLMGPGIVEEAAVEIWVGYKVGFIQRMALVFGDGVIDSVSARGNMRFVQVVQNGARKLNYPYYREIGYDFDLVTAEESVIALLDLAGVNVYVVDLDPWLIGSAVPQRLHFSNYGEAINKVSTVDGSEWFALPSGQIRVEKRDPLPYDNYKRLYYSGHMNGINVTAPAGVPDPDVQPRIFEIAKDFDRSGVNNFINVDGAALVTIGPNGEQNSEQIHEEVDGLPGNFANGAPWITTPPLFQPFTYSNELIDTNAKAFTVAQRYFDLKNRLIEVVNLSIPLDPEIFLCMTVKVVDEDTDTNNLYFLNSYHCSVSPNGVQTDLELFGGPFAGTQGFAKPFAEFRWSYSATWKMQGQDLNSSGCNGGNDMGFLSNLGAKLCQDLPAATGDEDKGGDSPTTKTGQVFIGFDGTFSQDFDGEIVSWTWSDDQGHTGTGPQITFIYDPDVVSSVQVTLVVEDNSGRTDTITKTVYTGADHSTPEDPSLNDTTEGGGEAAGECSEGGDPDQGGDTPPNGNFLVHAIAAECKAMMSSNNKDWNMLDKDDFPVGDFISVDVKYDPETEEVTALFGTDNGEIVKTTDGAQTGTVVHEGSNNQEEISDISFDPQDCGTVVAVTSLGQIIESTDMGNTWHPKLPRDGIRINKILFIDDVMYAFGGDTAKPDTLIRRSRDGGKTFSPVQIGGALGTAIRAAAPGGTIKNATVNDNGLIVGFRGVSPISWTTPDLDQQNWTPVAGLTGTETTAMAGGGEGGVISTDDGTFTSDDSEDGFTEACPLVLNDVNWEGLPGTYVGVSDNEMSKIVDNSCGPMMPNEDIPDQTPLPGCARMRMHKIIVGPYPPAGADPNWPTSQAGATQWISAGFNSSLWENCAALARGNPVVAVSDCVVTELASLAWTHGGNLDNSGPGSEKFYSVIPTGPSPVMTGVQEIQWFEADGPITGAISASWNADVDEDFRPYTHGIGGSISQLSIAVSVSLDNNKDAGFVVLHSSGLNFDSTVALTLWDNISTTPIGPVASPTCSWVTNWSQDTSPFSPFVCMWTYVAAGRLRII